MIFMEFVNLVKYKIYMDNKNKIKNQDNKAQNCSGEPKNHENRSGIYLRDDHCDWGSSGMNEFTNEFGKDS